MKLNPDGDNIMRNILATLLIFASLIGCLFSVVLEGYSIAYKWYVLGDENYGMGDLRYNARNGSKTALPANASASGIIVLDAA